MYWLPVAVAPRAFKMVLFTASHRNTFVGGTFALPSALSSWLVMFCHSENIYAESVYLCNLYVTVTLKLHYC